MSQQHRHHRRSELLDQQLDVEQLAPSIRVSHKVVLDLIGQMLVKRGIIQDNDEVQIDTVVTMPRADQPPQDVEYLVTIHRAGSLVENEKKERPS